MREDTTEAYRFGYDLGMAHELYSRYWNPPYVTGAARWAAVKGYEDAWTKRRAGAPRSTKFD
jgi:hypothetical protein